MDTFSGWGSNENKKSRINVKKCRAGKKYKWNHITLKKKKNTHTQCRLSIEKKGNWPEFCSFIGLYNIFFPFFLYYFFLNHFFSVLFLLLCCFFCVVSLFRIYGLLVYSSSLYRSCALFLVSPFGDRLCCRSNCDGSIAGSITIFRQ